MVDEVLRPGTLWGLATHPTRLAPRPGGPGRRRRDPDGVPGLVTNGTEGSMSETIGGITIEDAPERRSRPSLAQLREQRVQKAIEEIRRAGKRVEITDEFYEESELQKESEDGMRGKHKNVLFQWLLDNADPESE